MHGIKTVNSNVKVSLQFCIPGKAPIGGYFILVTYLICRHYIHITSGDGNKFIKCSVKPEMATFKFNLPLNAVESIKYALIQVFNSF